MPSEKTLKGPTPEIFKAEILATDNILSPRERKEKDSYALFVEISKVILDDWNTWATQELLKRSVGLDPAKEKDYRCIIRKDASGTKIIKPKPEK